MNIAELCVRRPVAAAVMSLIIVLFGLFVLPRLAVRELPAVESPVITVSTLYAGASPQVMDRDITEVVEAAVAGVPGVDTISSQSRRGQATTTIEFSPSLDLSDAANDVRDAVAGIANDLPEDAELPIVAKNDSDSDPIMRLSVVAENLSPRDVTDFVERNLIDRLAVLDGVAQVELEGEKRQAIRVWLDRSQMAARGVTADDVEQALQRNNVELPAGELRTSDRQFTVRADARLNDAADFARVVVKELEGGPVRLEDVARVSLGVEDDQTELRTNGVTSVGLSILRQSQANTVAISNQVRQEIAELANNLPPGMEILVAFDEANFVQASIQEVVKTLGITILIVVAVIFLFLGSGRALIVPAVTIPVALIGTFLGIYLFGFSINTLSLLALVLAVGILVDDAIVILENIQHHMARGATAAAASIVGTKQVFFAVIATSLTLISVFVPVSLMEGKIGLLFAEFGIVMALIVVVSTFVALTLCPMLASKLLQAGDRPNRLTGGADRAFARLEACYAAGLSKVIQAPWLVVLLTVALGVAAMGLYNKLPKELTTLEDRGVFFVSLTGPQGANFDYTNGEMRDVEHRLQPLLDSGEAEVVRSMSGFRGNSHRGFAVVSLADWDERDRSSAEIAGALIEPLSQVTGARAFPVLPAGLGLRGSRQPLQLVIGGYDHQEVKSWADSLIPVLEQNPNLLNIEVDYEENQPEFKVEVDRLRADDLGVSVEAIGRTLQSMIASQKVTTFVDRGREYDVIVQSDEGDRRNPHDLTSIYLKSDTSGQLVPLDALVSVNEGASAADLRRYERLPSITLSAALADGYDLGAAIAFATQAAQETLPDEARLAYSGLSKEFTDSAGAIFASVALAILVVYLVLAAQFESFRQPFVILLTVPLAVSGALLALWLTGTSLNIFSQIGLILLIGLMAKNGILIVDYANQLQAQGLGTREAALQAAQRRLRPIVMTLLSTLLGAIPLVMASGAGAESRFAIGTVIIGGLSATLCLTLFVIPVFYELFSARDKKQTAVPSPQGAKHLATDHPGQT